MSFIDGELSRNHQESLRREKEMKEFYAMERDAKKREERVGSDPNDPKHIWRNGKLYKRVGD